MPSHVEKRRTGALSDEAVSLFVRLQAEQASERDLRRLLEWSEQSPEKLEELEALSRFWQELGGMAPELAAETSTDCSFPPPPSVATRHWLRRAAAGGAALAATAFLVAVYFFDDVRRVFPSGDVYATAKGEVKEFVLSDESRLHLNGKSRVTVAFDEEFRQVELQQGEAFFEVAHDETRAFVVNVGDFEVRAVGTAFNIDFAFGMVDLAVLEGAVELAVKSPEEGAIAPMRVEFRERVTLEDRRGSATDMVELAPIRQRLTNIETIVAWRRGVINLTGESLAHAAEKINRQSRLQVAIGDRRVADYPIHGSFDADNLASFISAIEILYPVRSVRGESGYVLYAAEAGPRNPPS